MTTVNLGPFSFSAMLFTGMLAYLVLILGSWVADRKLNTELESITWKTTLIVLFVSRAAFIISYFDTYMQRPFSMLDLRDGGFSLIAACVAATVSIAWFSWRKPISRKPLIVAVTASLSVLGMSYAGLNLFSSPKPFINNVVMSTLDGKPVPVSEFRGKPTVVNLWASWCPPCRREMPALQEGQQSNPDIHFVFANQGEVAAVVDNYLTDEGLTLENVLLDQHGSLANDIKSRGLPTTLFLDAKGQLVDIRLGELSSATLQDRLDALRSNAKPMRSTKD